MESLVDCSRLSEDGGIDLGVLCNSRLSNNSLSNESEVVVIARR